MVTKRRRIRLQEKSAGGPAPTNNSLAPNTRPDMSKVKIGPDGAVPFAKTPFPAAFGATASGPTGNGLPIGTAPDTSEAAAFQAPKMQLGATGNSGTQIFGGYFSEEYLSEFRGRLGARKWDEIRRSEAQVAMLLNAVTNPIKSANWSFEAADDGNPEFVKHKDLVEMCLFDMIDFNAFKHEALTFVPFGFSILEQVHNVELNHPKFGTFNGLKALAFRSQKTIENWQLEPKTGRLIGVNQYTYSDLGGNEFIPGDFLIVFSLSKEGDNYEGISALRPMLGSYLRKELYLKLAAIGIERYAIGTPIGTVPKGKEKTKELDEFSAVLQNYTSHESSYIIKPEGWNIEIQKGDFDASKIKELLVFENTEMVTSLVANFLILGMHSAGGSLALGSNLSQFFTSGIQSYADIICDAINRQLVPNLVKLNFGPQAKYPKLKCTGISDKAGKELAETVKLLVDARAIDPDMPLQEFLRKQYKLPKPDPSTAVPLPAQAAGSMQNTPKPGEPIIGQPGKAAPIDSQLSERAKTIRLADSKYVKQFNSQKATLKALMQRNLSSMYADLRELLRKRYNSLSGSDKILAAKGVEMPGLNAYKKELRDTLAVFAAASIKSANAMVPSKYRLKLAEKPYDALPPAVRKLIDAQSTLVAETQAADIEKMSFFQFTSEATSTEDIDAILHAVDGKVLDSIDGSTAEGMSVDVAAGDALAHVVNEAATSFFMDPDVADGIESFTLVNEDPVSEICQELAGTTLAIGDPDLDRYGTPLHHNCKSRWVPNFKGDSNNPDIERDGVSLSKKALASMTLGEK